MSKFTGSVVAATIAVVVAAEELPKIVVPAVVIVALVVIARLAFHFTGHDRW